LAKTELDLLKAEDEVKKISLYLWLSYKMPEIFYDIENATKHRVLVNQYCEDSLKLNLKDLVVKRTSFKRDDKKEDNKKSFPKRKSTNLKKEKQTREDKTHSKGRAKQRVMPASKDGTKKHKIQKKEGND